MKKCLLSLVAVGLVWALAEPAWAVRTAISAQTAKGPYVSTPVAADSLDYTYSASDNTNGNYFVGTGRELVLVRNTAGGAGTITFTSVADSSNKFRKGDITTYSVGAGEFAMYWFGALPGWNQGSNQIYIDTSAATVTIAVIRIP